MGGGKGGTQKGGKKTGKGKAPKGTPGTGPGQAPVTYYSLKDNCFLACAGDVAAIIDANFKTYFLLNETAGFLVRFMLEMDGACSDLLIKKVTSQYKVDDNTAAAEITNLTNDLRLSKVLKEESKPTTTPLEIRRHAIRKTWISPDLEPDPNAALAAGPQGATTDEGPGGYVSMPKPLYLK